MHDSNKPDDPPANLPTDIEQRVEELAERFLEELQDGKSPDREQWVKAHPQIAQSLAVRLELVERMFRMVHGKGPLPKKGQAEAADSREGPDPAPPAPSPQPPERAIHLKCPHCGNRIQLVEPKAQEVLCENCGSSFELDPGTTTTYRPDDLPKAIGRFQVLELLGRGGFGAVYKARDAELDRTVAIKVPRAGYFGTPQEQERFLREARSAARLKHPNIVSVHEIGHDRGVPYIVSDYVEGLTLADLLTGGRPTFRESAELVARIADALDYAHREKVIHRDIKPSNILMQKVEGGESSVEGQNFGNSAGSSGSRPSTLDSRPFLTDFGLARRDEGEITVTLDGQVLGTPAYMPPEQAAGDQRKVDARSDVYSLGVVLYELLTGELPFRGNKRMLLHQVLHDDPRPPRSLNDRIPRDLETICLKAMSKEPARRYPTARELADDLRRYLTGDPINARPVSKPERLWRWCRRNPVLASLTSLTALALLAVAAVAASFAIYHSRSAERFSKLFNESEEHRFRAEERTATMLMNRGLEGGGDPLWLARALETTPPKATDLERRIRLNLAIFGQQISPHRRLLEHQGLWLESALFSPDSSKVVSFGGYQSDMTVRVWDTTTAKALLTFESHPYGSQPLAVSHDCKFVVTASGSTAQVWTLASGKQVTSPLLHQTEVIRAEFSPDGRIVLTGTLDGIAQLWDSATGNPIGTPLKHHVSKNHVPVRFLPVTFSPDGRVVLTKLTGPEVLIWETATGKLLNPSLGLEGTIRCAAFSADGRILLTGNSDNTARFWNVNDWEPLGPILPNRANAVAFSPDGNGVLTRCDDGTVRLWEATSGSNLWDRPIQGGGSNNLEFTPDGRFIMTVYDDQNGNLIPTLWESSTGVRICEFAEGHPLVFSPNGQFAVTLHGNAARIWDLVPVVGSPEVIALWAQVITRMELGPDELATELDEHTWEERRQHLELQVKSSLQPCSNFVVASAQDRLHWIREQARESELSEEWSAAIQHLDKLVEAEPTNWRLYDRRGIACRNLGSYDRAIVDFSKARELGGDDWYRGQDHWTVRDRSRSYELALLLLHFGDTMNYRRLCSETLERFTNPHYDQAASIISRMCTLAPQAVADFTPVVRLGERGIAVAQKSTTDLVTLGAAQYRAGQYHEAIQSLNKYSNDPRSQLFLALANHQLGHADESRQWLDKAAGWIEHPENKEKTRWNVWLELQILHREAQALIRGEKQ